MNPENLLRARSALIGLRSNAGPLDNVAVAFGSGVTALYGQNGAGKTWILDSLRRALRGRYRGINQLICQLEHDTGVYEWVMEHLADEVHESWYRSKSTPGAGAALLRGAIKNWFIRGGRYFKPYEEVEEIEPDLIEDLVLARSIALIPVGDNAAEWDVWLCLPRDVPAGTREVAAYQSAVEVAEGFAQKIADGNDTWREDDELSDEEYGLREQAEEKLYDELSLLEWEYIHRPIAGLVWEYRSLAMPDDVRRMLDPIIRDDLPIPMVKLFSARSIPFVLEDDDDEADIDSLTRAAFAKHFEVELLSAGSSLSLSTDMQQWVSERAQSANETYSLLLQDAPQLTLELRPLGQWVRDSPLHWCVKYGAYGHTKVPVSELSRAESRWARVAVRRALDLTGAVSVIVMDEPEAALHRAAERQMAKGLSELTSVGLQVIVATHSPEVLDARTTECLHVSNTNGKTSVGFMPPLGSETLSALGLSPSDLLGLYRIFLLVEGAHDEIVIRALCGELLDNERIKIVPMRGGRKLPGTVESQLLFDLSDAHLVAVLDDVRSQEIEDAWLEAQTRYLASGSEDAIDFLSQAFKQRKGDEYGWLVQWLSRALAKGVHSRVEPHGFTARDIIEYLPVEQLVPGAHKTWSDLRREHESAVQSLDRSKGLHDFKRWLTQSYGADISLTNVERAAKSVQVIPEEFLHFGYRLREIGARPCKR
ncbi:AAA family ATPase [Pseudarthrobacter sp. CC4]|uniref:AAA family ATPase n=1 Tax=Pseudarthrobacter sp. CC4 TaxID=3029190 RepID=UPI003B8BAAA3